MAVRECAFCAWKQGTSQFSMPSGVAVWTMGVAQHECLSPHVISHLRFQHGRETGAESRHQILRETRHIRSGDFWNYMTHGAHGKIDGSMGMIPRQTTVFATEEPRISKTKEGEAVKQRDQEHAHLVFWHSWDCAPWIWPQRPDREIWVLLQCSLQSEGGHSAKTTWIVACRQVAAPRGKCTLSPNFRNAWVSCPTQHYHTSASTLLTRFGPLRSIPLPEDEAAAKGLPLWKSGGDPAGIAECSWYASRTGLPEHVPAVRTALGSFCRCKRGQFWRRCWSNFNQGNTSVSIGPVSLLLDIPLYTVPWLHKETCRQWDSNQLTLFPKGTA